MCHPSYFNTLSLCLLETFLFFLGKRDYVTDTPTHPCGFGMVLHGLPQAKICQGPPELAVYDPVTVGGTAISITARLGEPELADTDTLDHVGRKISTFVTKEVTATSE